jgi:hypothetical protein
MSGREAEIVYRVVWDRKRMKVDLADAKVAARFYLLDPIPKRLSAFARLFIVNVGALADVGIASLGGNIYGTVNGSEQHAQAAGVVTMFMRDQHGIESLDVFADQREPTRNLFRAQSGVNQNPSFAGNDQNRIAS